jgi:hypothetical protein
MRNFSRMEYQGIIRNIHPYPEEDPSSIQCLTLSITCKGSRLLDLFIIYKSRIGICNMRGQGWI